MKNKRTGKGKKRVLFEKIIYDVIRFEGGYVNDPNDSGGETKYGISKKSYPKLDIKNLSKQQAVEIYYNDYWNGLKCYNFPDSISIFMFDTAINCGKNRASKILQKSLGVKVDGIIGKKTMAAVAKKVEYDLLVDLSMYRIEFYKSLRNFFRFKKGWVRRVMSLVILCSKFLKK